MLTIKLILYIIKIQGATDRRFALRWLENNHPKCDMGGCFFYFLCLIYSCSSYEFNLFWSRGTEAFML